MLWVVFTCFSFFFYFVFVLPIRILHFRQCHLIALVCFLCAYVCQMYYIVFIRIRPFIPGMWQWNTQHRVEANFFNKINSPWSVKGVYQNYEYTFYAHCVNAITYNTCCDTQSERMGDNVSIWIWVMWIRKDLTKSLTAFAQSTSITGPPAAALCHSLPHRHTSVAHTVCQCIYCVI